MSPSASSSSSSSEEAEPIPSPQTSFQAYHPLLLRTLASASRAAASLPEDIDFHRSLDRRFSRAVDRCADRLIALAGQLIQFSDPSPSGREAKGDGKGKGKELWKDKEELEDRYGEVVDVTDSLLERADTALDELLGRRRETKVVVNDAVMRKRDPTRQQPLITPSGKLAPEILNARIPKPQLTFPHPPNNFPPPHWTPQLKTKPHAKVPLGWKPSTSSDLALFAEHIDRADQPYAYEILTSSPPPSSLQPCVPQEPKSFDETPFEWVDTTEGLERMLERLRGAREVAVDLEHHDYRSYWGIVCLMQVSTREGDWVVDTLKLREELEVLNEVFADPNIVKVLHGAQMDVIWLQRDLNLYLLNLFDTYQASHVLSFPAHSLSFLLEYYASYKPDKRFQLADWRIRPLPKEMLEYARSDTHFLLYVYDRMRNDLLSHRPGSRGQGEGEGEGMNGVQRVFEMSKETALQYWLPEHYDPSGDGPTGWRKLAQRWNKHFFGPKEAVYRALHAWRDRVAREEDESLRFVLPNHQLFGLAETLPRDGRGVMACLAGGSCLALGKAEEVAALVRGTLEGERERERERREREREEELRRLEVDGAKAAAAAEGAKGRSEGSRNRFALLGVDEEMEDVPDETAAEAEASELPSVDIWGTAGDSLAAPTSSLFGPALLPSIDQPSPTLLAQSSNLFGSTLPSSLPGQAQPQEKTDFLTAVKQIHSSLFLAPTIHTLAPPSTSRTAPGSESAAATAEVPFVPKSARQTKPDAADDRETVVVVGQKKNKKRKRDRELQVDEIVENASSAAAAKRAPSAPGGVDEMAEDRLPALEGEEAGFDYAALPNILDDDPATFGKKPKRQKKGKGGQRSNAQQEKQQQQNTFKKPPKPRTEPKSGSRSMIFK